MPELSIIVPVYNVEKYIEDCIKSIVEQPYKDYELLLVDDGGQDRSSYVCDENAYVSENMIVVHKMNSGVSSARNIGLDMYRGGGM